MSEKRNIFMKNSKIFIHKSAFVDKGAKIGEGTKIWHNVHITENAIIGENCKIGQNCYIAGKLGNGCRIQNNVNIYKGVDLEDYVFCGPSMTFTNDLNPRAKYPKNGEWTETVVKEGASFGAGSVILCGITIGKHALIGAGSVVTKDISAYTLVYGNPAKIQGFVCECGKKMPLNFRYYTCTKCSRNYKQNKYKVEEIKKNKIDVKILFTKNGQKTIRKPHSIQKFIPARKE
ncbi:MAG: hypothetical protein A2857_06160 [Candidatus Levybacteria bacterium RIFCSPHIGHO2_01_FULL_36_15]|nr:MAG: hypothetical protein A2857_06160 [Candidatus Levybacteria bacterium RIFCSPHIGHO2_01_FULL_36_15]